MDNTRHRLWMPWAGIFFIFIAILLRLGQLQLFLHRPLAHKTQREIVTLERTRPLRGRLLDRNGKLLAVTVESPSVYISKKELNVSFKQAAGRLSRALQGAPETQILAALKTKSNFVWIKRGATVSEGKRVRALGLTGIGLTLEPKRLYPHAQTAKVLLGAVDVDGNGLSGLERGLNPLLEGHLEERVVLRDALGKVFAERAGAQWSLPDSFFAPASEKRDGPFDVYLTLDIELQAAAEERALDFLRRHEARAAIVVVEAAQTGALLALASRAHPGRLPLDNLDPNYGASLTFEPGSVLKPFVLAAALAGKLAHPQDLMDCEGGRFALAPGVVVRDHEPRKVITVEQVMIYSSNIGMAKIGMRLGRQPLYQTLRAFGFGVKTALPLTGEAVGLVSAAQTWTRVTEATVAFGQGIGVTALQLTNAYSALAEEGLMLEPQIIAKITPKRSAEKLYELKAHHVRQVMAPKAARQTLAILKKVVLEGTGMKASVSGYSVAGKTGTAQKVDPKTGKYSNKDVVVSFCGVVGSLKPELAICAILDEPRKPPVAWASEIAAPLFKAVAQDAINILGLQPVSSSAI